MYSVSTKPYFHLTAFCKGIAQVNTGVLLMSVNWQMRADVQACCQAVRMQVVTEEIWQGAVHAAAIHHDEESLLSLWQWLARNLHDWNAPNAAAQVMSAHALAASKPKQGIPSFSQAALAMQRIP